MGLIVAAVIIVFIFIIYLFEYIQVKSEAHRDTAFYYPKEDVEGWPWYLTKRLALRFKRWVTEKMGIGK